MSAGAGAVRTVGVVGAGAIGASWAAHLLAQGRHVVVTDPADEAQERLRAFVEPLVDAESLARLTFSPEITALRDVDLVIEAGPERLDVKRSVFAALDAVVRPDVLLTSSSSGLLPSDFQDACEHPERVLVAHPFNPPHLVPLVEVVGGRLTSPAAVDQAMTQLAALGKVPVRLQQELPGHVVNRLQAALWREAYALVTRGAISVADLDLAVANGPGLRWALLGPFATQHLSGGGQGIAHILAHLGPPMEAWWADLSTATTLDPKMVDAVVQGTDAELADVDEADLLARRDAALAQLIADKAARGL